MKIISVRSGFASDHSSTSYEFLAVDQPLGKEARAAVASLSSRAVPTDRRVSFIYHAEGYDIPNGWLPLMKDYYDVMYSESYDWWFLAMAFPLPPKQQEEILQYEFTGINELGVYISIYGERVIVGIHCCLDFGVYALKDWDLYDGYGYDGDYGEDDIFAPDFPSAVTKDPLLLLLARIREQLKEGDYRALYEVWKKYGYDVDENEEDDARKEKEAPSIPKERDTETEVIANFAELLATLY